MSPILLFLPEEVLKIDKEQFTIESDVRQIDIDVMRTIRNSPYGKTHFFDKHVYVSNLKQYYKNSVTYQGTPVDAFIFLLMPLIGARLAFVLLSRIKPSWKVRRVEKLEYPVVPLIYFQQTSAEAHIRRTSRKSVDAISKFFIIRANEAYVDIGEIRNSALTRQTLTRSPWALVRFLIRMQTVYSTKKQHRHGTQ